MNLIQLLLDEGIVKIKNPDEEPFTLKSGKKSRLFFDVKEASLNPVILKAISSHVDRTFVRTHEIIGSVAVGGIPIATTLSLQTDIPQIIVRSEKHETGTKSKIIGNCNEKNVILVEDVATSGGSLVQAVMDIRNSGGICNHCLVVINRQEGADELCEKNDIALTSILKKEDFGIIEG